MAPSGCFDGVSCWSEFTSALDALSPLDRGSAFEFVVRHHLRTAPAYRTKLADVWFHHEVPGEMISLLAFKAAIAADPAILCDYRILTIGVRQSDVAALVAANRWLDLDPAGPDEITALALAAHGVRHTVSFHSSIARARDFQALCNRLNAHLTAEAPIPAHHVSGKLGSAARRREIKAFLAQTPSLIPNARCLTEGVDIPSIDGVFFADLPRPRLDQLA